MNTWRLKVCAVKYSVAYTTNEAVLKRLEYKEEYDLK